MADQKSLSRSDVQRSFWLWTFFSHANYNYERLQGTAFAQAMTPIIKKLYTDPEDIKAALKRHLVFFNTERRRFSHVGIYLGDNRFIHAPKPGAVVRTENMRLAYWRTRFDGGRRLLD